ncbi:hemerythrin domain-containing protein [Mangrovibacterium marinum]|uniref:Regulator of cell morphogenesis and NO signaling n=1 Tax=Mangrovibacterium marinum TaxID=1639118 RepID=A0A2T5C5V5_9BACT|nr:hemerythrin domain-containing protein [Mangrovibacterium marinum]PTN10300.1 regulator of cell morphogenesis and NO signaling [Mangrovibacterium marinum]
MKIFTKDNKISSLVATNSNLIPVINRFGILLGFKEKTIEEICLEKNVNTDFFLAIVNTYTNENYFPEDELLSFSPLLLIDYLKTTHRYYNQYVLPKIERLLAAVMQTCAENCSSLKMISSFYQKFKTELHIHLAQEDEKVFPYIIDLYHNRVLTEGKSIRKYEDEHTSVEEKLSDLKNLVIKYLEPTYDPSAMVEFLNTLFQFEKDLFDHARIEDLILIKQVIRIEEELKTNAAR